MTRRKTTTKKTNGAKGPARPAPKVPVEYAVGSEVSVGDEYAELLESSASAVQQAQMELGELTYRYEFQKNRILEKIDKAQQNFDGVCVEVGKKIEIPVGMGVQNWMYLLDTKAFRRLA